MPVACPAAPAAPQFGCSEDADDPAHWHSPSTTNSVPSPGHRIVRPMQPPGVRALAGAPWPVRRPALTSSDSTAALSTASSSTPLTGLCRDASSPLPSATARMRRDASGECSWSRAAPWPSPCWSWDSPSSLASSVRRGSPLAGPSLEALARAPPPALWGQSCRRRRPCRDSSVTNGWSCRGGWSC